MLYICRRTIKPGSEKQRKGDHDKSKTHVSRYSLHVANIPYRAHCFDHTLVNHCEYQPYDTCTVYGCVLRRRHCHMGDMQDRDDQALGMVEHFVNIGKLLQICVTLVARLAVATSGLCHSALCEQYLFDLRVNVGQAHPKQKHRKSNKRPT